MTIEVYSTGKDAYRIVKGTIKKDTIEQVRSWIETYNEYYTSDFDLDRVDKGEYIMVDSEDNRKYVIKVTA